MFFGAVVVFALLQTPTAPPDPAADPAPSPETPTAAPEETAPSSAPPSTTTTTETAPPVVELAPPPAPPAPAPAAPTPKKKPVREPVGFTALPTAAFQSGAGTAACCVSCCCTFPLVAVPYVGPFLWYGAVGVVTGTVETFVGDAVGQDRSALVWPVLTGAGILVVGGAIAEITSVAIGLPTNVDPNNATVNLQQSAVPLTIVGVSAVAAIVAPVVVYSMTAVPKEPGDTGGFSVPGFVAPADPTGTRAAKEQPPPPPTTALADPTW